MPLVVDTATVDDRERGSYWAKAQEALFFPLDVEPGADTGFAARALAHDLGPVRIRRIAAGPSRVVRTPRAIAKADPERLELTMMVRGLQERVQDGRSTTLGEGDITTTDTSRPFEVSSTTPFEMLTFSVPKALLARDAERLLHATATPVCRESGVGAVLGPFLRSVGDGLRDGRVAESDTSLGDGIVDLARGLYADGLPRNSRRAALLVRIQAWIDERLQDTTLSPATIAAEHFISVRHLHGLFASDGLTVSAWIRDRRLERCRRDLADPALAGETVASIAYGWGFRNPRHFSRVYRAAFGSAPSDGRAVH
jgi:AraC-like DNA-binding protein